MEELDILTLLLLAIYVSEPFLHDNAPLRDCTNYPIILPDPCSSPDGIPMPLWGLDHCRIPIGAPYDGDQIELGQCDTLKWGKILVYLARLKIQEYWGKGISTT
jgi:hypothetical protein